MQGLCQRPRWLAQGVVQVLQGSGRQCFSKQASGAGALQPALHGAAQIRLRQVARCGVNGRKHVGQALSCSFECGVQHGAAHIARFQFAAQQHLVTHCQRFNLAGVEVEKSRSANTTAIIHADEQLAARAIRHLASCDRAFNLHAAPRTYA